MVQHFSYLTRDPAVSAGVMARVKMNRILVIHHSTRFLSRTASSLIQAGFEVLTTKDITEAIARPDESSLIICEISSKGYSFKDLSLLRKLSSSFIVAVGNYPSREAWGRTVEAGAGLYLEEPIGSRELIARIKAIMRRKKSSNNFNPIRLINTGCSPQQN